MAIETVFEFMLPCDGAPVAVSSAKYRDPKIQIDGIQFALDMLSRDKEITFAALNQALHILKSE